MLGLPMEGVVPALMRALCREAHCDDGVVLWLDTGGGIANLYAQNLPSPSETLAWFSPRRNGHAVAHPPVQGSAVLLPRQAVETCANDERDFGSEQHQPAEPHCPHRHLCGMAAPSGGPTQRLCCAVVRDGVPVAALMLYRPATEAGFSSDERAAVKAAGRYLSLSGCTMPIDTGPAMYRGGGERALLLCEPDGRVAEASANGFALLAQACGCPINRRTVPDELERAGRILIRRLLAEVATPAGTIARNATPTATSINAWGQFRLSVFIEPNAPHGVLIERVEHLLVRLIEAMWHLDLSVQQGEALLLLAQGLSHDRIADRMGVSPNTADYHVRQLYMKLGAHTRNEAIACVLDSAESRANA